ncbi:UNVERIFIED_CONTAM: hypothetical protein Sangu_2355000 [Sesamum angustifolium]|uniref:Uncharacterized protein n=1 Tax=Sesamum angustifolium TaxID=2727405 RepID=A0AAW2KVR5_9LAMI
MSGSSPSIIGAPVSEAATGQVSRHNEGAAAAVSERSSKDGIRERRRAKREESSGRFPRTDAMFWKDEGPQDGNDLARDSVSGNSEFRDKGVKMKGGHRHDRHLKTLSDQLKDVPAESDDAASSRNHGNGRHSQVEKIAEEAGASVRHGSSLNRGKKAQVSRCKKKSAFCSCPRCGNSK